MAKKSNEKRMMPPMMGDGTPPKKMPPKGMPKRGMKGAKKGC